jgi:hypothetical protein
MTYKQAHERKLFRINELPASFKKNVPAPISPNPHHPGKQAGTQAGNQAG